MTCSFSISETFLSSSSFASLRHQWICGIFDSCNNQLMFAVGFGPVSTGLGFLLFRCSCPRAAFGRIACAWVPQMRPSRPFSGAFHYICYTFSKLAKLTLIRQLWSSETSTNWIVLLDLILKPTPMTSEFGRSQGLQLLHLNLWFGPNLCYSRSTVTEW